MKIKIRRKLVFWYIKLVAANGETLLVSEVYYSRSNARRAALTLSDATKIPIEE